MTTRFTGRGTGLLLGLLLLCAITAPPLRAEETYATLWGTEVGRTYNPEDASGKWTRALERFTAEGFPTEVAELITSLRDGPRIIQIESVNAFWNHLPYETDRKNYGASDYWATPTEALERGRGDCEDYAIGKYLTLIALGWDPGAMRIVVVAVRGQEAPHAVLAVEHGGRLFILDNRLLAPARAELVRDYRPLYSVNEFNWWRHNIPLTLPKPAS